MRTLLTLFVFIISINSFGALPPDEQEKVEKYEISKSEVIRKLVPEAYDVQTDSNLFDLIVKKERGYNLYLNNIMVMVDIIYIIDDQEYCGPAKFRLEVRGLFEAFVGQGIFIYPLSSFGDVPQIGLQTEQGEVFEVLPSPLFSESSINGVSAAIAGYFISSAVGRIVFVVDKIDYVQE